MFCMPGFKSQKILTENSTAVEENCKVSLRSSSQLLSGMYHHRRSAPAVNSNRSRLLPARGTARPCRYFLWKKIGAK